MTNTLLSSPNYKNIFYTSQDALCWAESTTDPSRNNKTVANYIFDDGIINNIDKIIICHPSDDIGSEDFDEYYYSNYTLIHIPHSHLHTKLD